MLPKLQVELITLINANISTKKKKKKKRGSFLQEDKLAFLKKTCHSRHSNKSPASEKLLKNCAFILDFGNQISSEML